jgi:Na+/proline symporter
MEEYRQPIVLFCVGAYMVACVAVGLWAMRRTKNAGDFFMAGRHLGAFVTAMAVFPARSAALDSWADRDSSIGWG